MQQSRAHGIVKGMNKIQVLSATALASLSIISFSSCAHHRDVRPGVDGVHHVLVRSEDKEKAERDAISQAEHYCQMTNRMPAFVEEKTSYTGSMDEATRDTVRKASTAAILLGGVAHGSQSSRTGGNVLGSAGAVGTVMTSGDDYVSDMKFKCQ